MRAKPSSGSKSFIMASRFSGTIAFRPQVGPQQNAGVLDLECVQPNGESLGHTTAFFLKYGSGRSSPGLTNPDRVRGHSLFSDSRTWRRDPKPGTVGACKAVETHAMRTAENFSRTIPATVFAFVLTVCVLPQYQGRAQTATITLLAIPTAGSLTVTTQNEAGQVARLPAQQGRSVSACLPVQHQGGLGSGQLGGARTRWPTASNGVPQA